MTDKRTMDSLLLLVIVVAAALTGPAVVGFLSVFFVIFTVGLFLDDEHSGTYSSCVGSDKRASVDDSNMPPVIPGPRAQGMGTRLIS
jgi:hypothetical protein